MCLLLRRLSTARLLALLAAAAAAAAAVAVLAVAASGRNGATPPAKPLAQALHDAAAAPAPAGITARARFTNDLVPSSSLLGGSASALLTGASGRLWATNDGRGRLELQSDAGDVQVVWTPTRATVYDASSNTVYRLERAAPAPKEHAGAVPGVDEIRAWLARLAGRASVAGPTPATIAGRPAYEVTVSPEQHGGLVGSADLAWDARHGVPLQIGVTARGASSPVLQLRVTDISFGPVPASSVDVAPPAAARVVDLGVLGAGHRAHAAAVTGLPAVRAAAPFALVAPSALGGKPLTSARLVGSDGALLSYGEGLDALVVLERAAGSGASSLPPQLGALPKASIGGTSAPELATPLGTVLRFERDGVSFVVGGSLPRTDVEAAARALAS